MMSDVEPIKQRQIHSRVTQTPRFGTDESGKIGMHVPQRGLRDVFGRRRPGALASLRPLSLSSASSTLRPTKQP